MSVIQYTLTAFIVYIVFFFYYVDFQNVSPVLNYNGVEFLTYYGYEGEEHVSISEDGFRSKIHRIGHGGPGKKVLIYVPGLHCRSEISFAFGPKFDIGYHLYEAGIDVWFINLRGSSNTKPMENISHSDDQLTNFSFHEQGFDLAAAIDYILGVTKQDKVTISGLSLGASVILVLLADKPEYNRKVEKVILFGPTGPFSVLTTYFQTLVLNFVNANKAIADYSMSCRRHRTSFAHLLCTHPLVPFPCWRFLKAYLGFHIDGLNETMGAVVFKLLFTGPYTGIYDHLLQTGESIQFVRRDFGREVNMKRYGSEMPPAYNMTNIQVPIIIFDSVQDKFLTPKARRDMHRLIPNIRKVIPVQPPFEHGNFVTNGVFDKEFVQNAIQAVLENT